MAELHAFQKAAVVLLGLRANVAGEVARQLRGRELTRLTETISQLPDLPMTERSRVFREFQEGLDTPFASLAENRPGFFARQLQSRYLRGGAIRLELGLELYQKLVGMGRGRYDYLKNLRLGPAWRSLDGPHKNEQLEGSEFRFLREGEVLDRGEVQLADFLLLDPKAEDEFAGCRFRRLSADQVAKEQLWSGVALDPAQVLAWRTRVLLGPVEDARDRAPRDEILTFLSVARERSSRRSPLSQASDWLRGAKVAGQIGLEGLDLEQLLAASGPDFSPLRAALLLWAWSPSIAARNTLYQQLSASQRRQLTRALIELEESAADSGALLESLGLFNCWSEKEKVEIIRDVLDGASLPFHPIDTGVCC